jgi:hypothetical protein
MATKSEEMKTVGEVQAVSENAGSKKKVKQKGASHALRWDILDNDIIKAEQGWEAELQEFWTSKTCKIYVKMYHIGKLWPRECHESHTRYFACKPWLCKDDHFLHRAEEVWRALFGDRPKSKGFFNYSLLSMVYSELILKRNVDWTTFPTTAEFPLRLGRGQKHIPDLYNHESPQTKSILENLKTKPRGAMVIGIMPKKEDGPSTTCPAQQRMENMVGNILSTMFPKHIVEEEKQKGKALEEIEEDRAEGGKDNVPQKLGGDSAEMVETTVHGTQSTPSTNEHATIAGPSNTMPTTLERNSEDPITAVDTVRLIQDMLRTMPDKDELKELLDFSIQWANVHTEREEEGRTGADEEGARQSDEERTSHVLGVCQLAHHLKGGAGVLAAMAPNFVDMAITFAKITPKVVAAAIGFDQMVAYILPMLKGRAEDTKTIIRLEEQNNNMNVLIGELVKELEEFKQKGASTATQRPRRVQERREEDVDVPVCNVHMVDVQSSSHSSDCLILSKFEGVDGADSMPKSAKIPPPPSGIGDVVEIGCSQVQSEARGKEKVILPNKEEDMESVLQKLEVASKERDAARAELESLRKTFALVDDTPSDQNVMPWLAWVHRLLDREIIVSKASNSLKKHAAGSRASRELLEASLERFKKAIGDRGREPTEITIWGDAVEMMDRTNYHRKGTSKDIDWALEVEEGWVPYNIFSSHFVESERTVIHTCDPRPTFLDDKCSLCQEFFGPEGAYTLGQCGHNFHITCIAVSSMRQSVCPMCRSPISSRFYEMMGLRDVMPPGHEFNRWNLPLDQLPKKFLNYREWGRPLSWNSELSCHQLYEEYGMERDPFFWMTQDYEVEIRAREIEDVEQRELFCRNFGGHWSTEQKRFFRFPPKKVERRDDGSWHEVGGDNVWGEEYKKYNRTLVGRALFLAKLEGAAKLRSSVDEASFEDAGCCYWDAVHAFDKRIGDVIEHWRNTLRNPQKVLLISFEENDKFVNTVVGRVDKAMEILAAKRVDPAGKRKREDATDSDDSWESEMRREIAATDREYVEGGRIARPSQRAHTRSATKRQRMDEASGSRRSME